MSKYLFSKKHLWRKAAPYVFISPFFILYSIFGLWTSGYSLFLSFHKYHIGSPFVWVGLENYIEVFQDERFFIGLKNTIYMWLGSLSVQIVLSFFFALLLNIPRIKGRGLLRAVYYLPVISSLIAVSLTFKLLFNEDFGWINRGLNLLRITSIPWLSSPEWARVAVILIIIWGGTGWYIVIFLAGLQGINKQYYEAALIDGANRIQQIFYITLPLLKPVFTFCIIMGTIAGLQIFMQPFVLFAGSGGPGLSGLTIVHNLYDYGFKYLKFGYASAIAYVLFFIILVFSLFQLKFLSLKER